MADFAVLQGHWDSNCSPPEYEAAGYQYHCGKPSHKQTADTNSRGFSLSCHKLSLPHGRISFCCTEAMWGLLWSWIRAVSSLGFLSSLLPCSLSQPSSELNPLKHFLIKIIQKNQSVSHRKHCMFTKKVKLLMKFLEIIAAVLRITLNIHIYCQGKVNLFHVKARGAYSDHIRNCR
jgi:hypothetical protein